jgi:hypothetical protein
MAILAYLAPESVPVELLHPGFMSFIERGNAIAALREVSLINLEMTRDSMGSISVHRLIQLVMRARLRNCGAEGEAAAAALLLVARAFPLDDELKSRSKCAALFPHALAVLDNAPHLVDGIDDQGWLAHNQAQLSQRVGRYRKQLNEGELGEALMSFSNDARAAEIVASRLSEFRPEVRRRFLRLAMEQSDNEHLQPIRDALKSQPAELRREIKSTVKQGAELMKRLRELLALGTDDAISRLIADHLDEFPMDMQEKLKRGYEHSKADETGLFDRYRSEKNKSEARAHLRNELKIPQPITLQVKTKSRRRWLRPWRDSHS